MRIRPAKQVALSAAAAALLVLTGLGYLLLLQRFGISNAPVERQFSSGGTEKESVQFYIEAVSVDALDKSMQMRVTLAPSPAMRGPMISAPDRDLTLLITHGKTVQELRFPANVPTRSATFEVALGEGNVANYPIDSYRADLGLECLTKLASPSEIKSLPMKITLWAVLLGFQLEARAQPGGTSKEVHLIFQIVRSNAFALFALATYGAMAIIGLCTLTIGVLTFTGFRRPEATLVGALGAAVFALPALRNALPGAPPIGVRADFYVFLWTELAAVIALGLMVSAWVRLGPRSLDPPDHQQQRPR